MLNFDQAEGLRRMLETRQQTVLSFLSTLPETERNGTVINLSASLVQRGQRTLIVDAKVSDHSVSTWLNLRPDQSLLDVARQRRTMDFAMKELSPGLFATKVCNSVLSDLQIQEHGFRSLSKVFDIAASRSDVVMVDCDLDRDDRFALCALDDSRVVIQLSADANTIKGAYSMMKRLYSGSGVRHFGVVVTNVNQAQADLIFANLASTARRYLAVELELLGAIPDDPQMKRATNAGRSVVEAFPLSKAAHAFARIADKLISGASSRLHFESAPLAGAHFEY